MACGFRVDHSRLNDTDTGIVSSQQGLDLLVIHILCHLFLLVFLRNVVQSLEFFLIENSLIKIREISSGLHFCYLLFGHLDALVGFGACREHRFSLIGVNLVGLVCCTDRLHFLFFWLNLYIWNDQCLYYCEKESDCYNYCM